MKTGPLVAVTALVGMIAVYSLVQGVGSAMALADISTRPIIAFHLEQGTKPVPVQQPGKSAQPDEARLTQGIGVRFGYSFTYILPNGETVQCAIRFRLLRCTGGWTAERATAPPQG